MYCLIPTLKFFFGEKPKFFNLLIFAIKFLGLSFNPFLSKIGLVDPYVTPHINLVCIDTLPWNMIEKSSILLLDQFGVFRKTHD